MSASANDVVVIGVDGSDQAEQAFEWYLEHLHKKGNTIVLVHAMEVPSMPTRDSWEKQMEAGKNKTSELQNKFTKRFEELEISGKFVADHEKPGQLVCDIAKQENATYVVMGTRGLGKVRRTMMGSVSDYCVHHASCPVVVCRVK